MAHNQSFQYIKDPFLFGKPNVVCRLSDVVMLFAPTVRCFQRFKVSPLRCCRVSKFHCFAVSEFHRTCGAVSKFQVSPPYGCFKVSKFHRTCGAVSKFHRTCGAVSKFQVSPLRCFKVSSLLPYSPKVN